MKNKYKKVARISEQKTRQIIKAFSLDIPALTTSMLYGINYRTVHTFYTLLRERVVSLAVAEMEPFAGEIEVDE